MGGASNEEIPSNDFEDDVPVKVHSSLQKSNENESRALAADINPIDDLINCETEGISLLFRLQPKTDLYFALCFLSLLK